MRSRRLAALLAPLLALALISTACGDDDGGGSPLTGGNGGGSGENEGRSGENEGGSSGNRGGMGIGGGGGTCSVDITGEFEVSWTSGGGVSAVGSDYWSSDETLEGVAGAVGGDDVAENEFLLYGLILNCVGDSTNSMSILTTAEANKDNFPFGPGTYDISGGALLGSDGKSLVSSIMTTTKDGDTPLFKTVSGTLDITRFDGSGITATATMELEESFASGTPRTATLDASFDFDCTGDACR